MFQNGEGENVEIVNNISQCVSNVAVDVEHEQGESGSLAGYVEAAALVENSYFLVHGKSYLEKDFRVRVPDSVCLQ